MSSAQAEGRLLRPYKAEDPRSIPGAPTVNVSGRRSAVRAQLRKGSRLRAAWVAVWVLSPCRVAGRA